MQITRVIIFAAIYWLASAYWLHDNGDPFYVWAGLLPAVYIAFISLLRE